MDKKIPKKYWTDEEWDNYNEIHRIHKQIMGFSLNNSVKKFYITITLIAIILSFFLAAPH
jgi:hypothetical protein